MIELPPYPPGLLVPAVYARIAGTRRGERISAAIGIGVSRESYGVIMEHVAHTPRGETEAAVRSMVEEGFRIRGLRLDEVIVAGAEHTVERAGCAVAVALFWPAPTGLA